MSEGVRVIAKGWEKLPTGKWAPVRDADRPPRPGDSADVTDVDETLDASHRRLKHILALQTARLEVTAAAGTLKPEEVEELGRLGNTWRILVSNEPATDLGDLSDEEIAAKLAAVNKRGK